MAAYVVPHAEVGVVVLATGFKEMRVVGDNPGGDAFHFHGVGDVGFPELDGAPGFPEEVPGAAEYVVAGGHAGQ